MKAKISSPTSKVSGIPISKPCFSLAQAGRATGVGTDNQTIEHGYVFICVGDKPIYSDDCCVVLDPWAKRGGEEGPIWGEARTIPISQL